MRRPSRLRSSPASHLGSSLIAAQAARARAIAKAGLSARPAFARMRFLQSTELREGGGQPKICQRIVSVRLDRPSTPRVRLLPTAEVELRDARGSHPDVSQRIAWIEAQGLLNVSLCFFGATGRTLHVR